MAKHISSGQIAYNPFKVDTNASLALAQRGSKNISDMVAEKERDDQLNIRRNKLLQLRAEENASQDTYRTNATDLAKARFKYTQEGPQRLLDAEQVKVDASNFRAQKAMENEAAAGGSRSNSFFDDPKTQAALRANQAYMNLGAPVLDGSGALVGNREEAIAEFRKKFEAQNRRGLSDPKTFFDTVLKSNLEAIDPKTGKKAFSGEQARARATASAAKLFSTLSPEEAKLFTQKFGSGGNGRGSNGRDGKLLSSSPNAMNDQQLADDYVSNNELSVSSAFQFFGMRPFDFSIKALGGNRNPTKSDVVTYISRMSSDAQIPAYAALKAIQQFTSNGVTSVDITDMTGDDIKDLSKIAKGIMATQERTRGGANGSNGQFSTNEFIANQNNAILGKMGQDQSNNAKLLKSLMSGLPQNPTKPAVPQNTQGSLFGDTAANVETPQLGLGNSANTDTQAVDTSTSAIQNQTGLLKANPDNYVGLGRTRRLKSETSKEVKELLKKDQKLRSVEAFTNVTDRFNALPNEVSLEEVQSAMDMLKESEGSRLLTSKKMKELQLIRTRIRQRAK